ncbi:hypothetical protein [Nitrosomonas supralitoralis]|uniref:Uncharacterized protein n=1 Tax=Nitrosomonas supralitoralis TaxID=2116706 RepID=A0A2P7NRR5_9PROT|nr:hypothetical protein [Nitrosomonas supralitoralis]PSJ16154.1 hypothetical protein C7H79_15065 [Nitrosomonas supralitoralis]
MADAIIDNIPKLNHDEINSSITIPLTPTSGVPKYDLSGMVFGTTQAPFDPTYKFFATEGATYSLLDTSFFDPYLRLYDRSGNAIATNSEDSDSAAEIIFSDLLHDENGEKHSLDVIIEWTAPYSGIFFIKPGWEQELIHKNYLLVVSSDMDTAVQQISQLSDTDTDRIFNWGESAYTNLFPEHQNSQADVQGYYARIYSNGDALGERDGIIYYYDGGTDGTGEIVAVGTISDYLPQAVAAGF